MNNVLNIILSLIIIVAPTIFIKIFYNKVKANKIIKQISLGLIFGLISIACSLISIKTDSGNYISVANSAVVIGGLLFGGPVGIIAGAISAIERFFSIYYGFLEATRYASMLGLLFAGGITFIFNKLVNVNNRIKFHFIIVTIILAESFTALLIFLTNMNDLSAAYYIVNSITLYSILFNVIVTIITIIPVIILNRSNQKIEKPLSIQSKVQIRLGFAVVVGFAIVNLAVYGILNNISKESTKSTMTMSIDDIENNIDDDMSTDIIAQFKIAAQSLKQIAILSFKDVDNLKTITEKCNFNNITIVEKNGNISVTSDPYLENFTNISEFNIPAFESDTQETIVTDLLYVDQKDGYFKYLFQYYNLTKQEEYFVAEINIDQYKTYVLKSVKKGIAARHLGENGFVIVCDDQNNVLSSGMDLQSQIIDFDIDKLNTISVVKLEGKEYYSYVNNFYGYNIIGLIEKEAADLNRNISIYITSFTAVLVFALLYIIIYLSINAQVIKPLINVNKTLDKICDGKLDEKVDESSSMELKVLSTDINSTVEALKDYMGKEAKMIQDDLNFAKSIQHSALPSTFPPFPSHHEFDIYALMTTAKEVGGDFYDFHLVDEDHLCILIADVSGKGVPAALFMMQSKTIIKSYIESKIPLGEAFTLANKKVCEMNSTNMFVTVWCGILDLKTGYLEYVNAGHNQPLIKNTEKYQFLECRPGFIFGVMDTMKYKVQSIQLEKNAELFLYTDGVNEAESTSKELFGNDRMLENANRINSTSSQEFCEQMLQSVKNFTKDAEQSDDITELHIKYFGN